MRRELGPPGFLCVVMEPFWDEDLEASLKRLDSPLNLKDPFAAVVQLEATTRKECPGLLFPYASITDMVKPLLPDAALSNVSQLLTISRVPFPVYNDSKRDPVQRWEYFCQSRYLYLMQGDPRKAMVANIVPELFIAPTLIEKHESTKKVLSRR